MYEKVRAINDDLLKKRAVTPRTSPGEAPGDSLKASRGWFGNFRKSTNIHSVVKPSAAATSHVKTADVNLKTFHELIEGKRCISQQVFSYETELFWKQMANRTCKTEEENMMPGPKPIKGITTLTLFPNLNGD